MAVKTIRRKTDSAKRKLRIKTLRCRGMVSALLVRGYTHEKIKSVLYEREALSYKTTQKLIDMIYKAWVDEGEQDIRVRRRRAIEARKEIISAAWARSNLDVVLRAEDSLSDIEGTKWNEKIDEDKEITFNVRMIGSKSDKALIDEFENDLEHPERFDKRMEDQLQKFAEKYQIRDS